MPSSYTKAYHPRQMNDLATAAAHEQAGDAHGADALYASLYDQARPDPAVLLAWSRLRRRLGDAKNADTMLNLARRAGGGGPVLIEMASLLIDQGQGERAGAVLREAVRLGRSPALDYEMARWEALHRRLPQAANLFRAVMRAAPNHLQARYGLARTLASMGQMDEAAGAYAALLKRDPHNRQLLSELAQLRVGQARFDDALSLYDRIEQAGGDVIRELSQVALGMMQVCDWQGHDALIARLASRMALIKPAIFDTLPLLASSDDPALHRRMAERFAGALRDASATRQRPAPRGVGPIERRLRIGYLGVGLHPHAATPLPAGVIEAHDRTQVETFAYDHSAPDESPSRARVMAAFDHVVALGGETPAVAAARIAADEIDILIDLKGYTERSRSELLCLRPAPVQVSFLAYPATQGAEWVDYVIADHVVLPPDQAAHWIEAVVRLPGSAWAGDQSRPKPSPDTDRAAHGLPMNRIVFACFCHSFQISPEMFANWMEILRRVPGSVLWLAETNGLAPGNLRGAARRAGIDPARLAFAKPATLEHHFARHGCADLFLDTAPFGAHAAAMDALWAGLPMITCQGVSVASRVGASMLQAAGLPELIAHDMESYVAMAVDFAGDPDRRAALRAHLFAARDTAALFDATAFARALEAAFRIMAEANRQGRAPQAIDLGE